MDAGEFIGGLLFAGVALAVIYAIAVPSYYSNQNKKEEQQQNMIMEYKKDQNGICYAFSTLTTDRFTYIPCEAIDEK